VDLAVALACIAGAGWALNIVVVRWALDRTGAPSTAGAFVGIASSAVLALAILLGTLLTVLGGAVISWESGRGLLHAGALSRGRVGIVTPLSNATQNTVVVVLSGIFFGARERSTKVVLALAMVVSGGVLISTR
jgi:hypothetical protein